MTPGRNPSITTSALLAAARHRSRPLAVRRSMAIVWRPRSTMELAHPLPSGRSIRTTSAPRSASNIAQWGPGPILTNSSTRRPARGPVPPVAELIPQDSRRYSLSWWPRAIFVGRTQMACHCGSTALSIFFRGLYDKPYAHTRRPWDNNSLELWHLLCLKFGRRAPNRAPAGHSVPC
jgi:hypothetical protein